MNRLQSELHARRVSEVQEHEPEVLALCGIEVAKSLLSLSGIERIAARGAAIVNARYDQLQADLDHTYVEASANLTDAANQIGHGVEAVLDRTAYAEAYGIDESDDPAHILQEGRWLRVRQGKFPSSTYSN